jgi:hypothetical protein
MNSFEDLKFKEHENNFSGIQSTHTFDNGYTLSVIGGDSFYGDGENTFEVGVLYENGFTRKFFNDDIDEDVRGWLSKSEVTELIKKIKKSA